MLRHLHGTQIRQRLLSFLNQLVPALNQIDSFLIPTRLEFLRQPVVLNLLDHILEYQLSHCDTDNLIDLFFEFKNVRLKEVSQDDLVLRFVKVDDFEELLVVVWLDGLILEVSNNLIMSLVARDLLLLADEDIVILVLRLQRVNGRVKLINTLTEVRLLQHGEVGGHQFSERLPQLVHLQPDLVKHLTILNNREHDLDVDGLQIQKLLGFVKLLKFVLVFLDGS